MQHYYAVTCQHVLMSGASIIRINTKDGKSRLIELEPHDWEIIPGGDDMCAVDITERISTETDKVSYLLQSLIVTKKFAADEQLEIGEDGFMLGMFAEQPGIEHNMVAARFGNVSLLASERCSRRATERQQAAVE